MAEEWLPVVGFEGFYEVSSLGRVRSLDRVETLTILGTNCERQKVGRILKPNGASFHDTVNICVRGSKSRRRVHRLVAEAFHGPRPKGLETAHRDGNARNNRADNLRYLTPSQNNLEKREHGTLLTRANGHPRAKLTVNDVEKIRRLATRGTRKHELAEHYGVCVKTIYNVLGAAT